MISETVLQRLQNFLLNVFSSGKFCLKPKLQMTQYKAFEISNRLALVSFLSGKIKCEKGYLGSYNGCGIGDGSWDGGRGSLVPRLTWVRQPE